MPKFRIGKTRKDRESGAKARNEQNKALRGQWSHDVQGFPMSRPVMSDPRFPTYTCNGKRTRSLPK